MEKILEIKEFSRNEDLYNGFDGYQIVTNKQIIEIGISNHQSCCESFGYISSEDDFDDYIGQELVSIERVDTALNKDKIEKYINLDEEWESGDAMFININTPIGTLQFAVYNSHNGYYGHEVYIKSNQLTIETHL